MNYKTKLKQAVVAIFSLAVVFVTGFSGKALAVDINTGALVLAMFGNNNEFIYNLGSESTLMTPGAVNTFSIGASTLSSLQALKSGDTTANPVQWALVGFDVGTLSLYAGSSIPPSAYTATQLSQVTIANPFNTTLTWALQSSGDGLTSKLLNYLDSNSYTTNFGTDGSIAGGFPVPMQSAYGGSLSVIQGDFSNALTLLGTGMMSADGSLLTLCGGTTGCPVGVVPIPAAVVLFGTGLVGLVGVARRNLMAA